MKIFTLIIPALFFLTSFQVSILDKVRANYDTFLSDKALCQKTISELEKAKDNSVTHLGYLGGLQTIRANHVFSPISKLNTFNKGKNNIEQAIKKDPNNAELRFIRLSVQKNAPFFLGYKSNIREDTELIKKNRSQIKSDILKNNIEALLRD